MSESSPSPSPLWHRALAGAQDPTEQRVLAVSKDVMLKWRLLVERWRGAGPISLQPDLIIGASATSHDLTVVTCDFDAFDLRICYVVMSPAIAGRYLNASASLSNAAGDVEFGSSLQ